MKLKQLHLTNFRPVVDEGLEFSQDSERNITVVHGQNGSGKTTLLNGIQWVLYGEADFDTHPDRLVNQGVMAEMNPGEQVTVSVQLEYGHEGVDYRLTRQRTFEREHSTDFDGQPTDNTLKLEKRANGSYSKVGNPSHQVEQVLPQRLSDLFLFDGEYIDKLSGVDYSGEIQTAIQNVMGLTILERSIDHLQTVEKRFENEMREQGSTELEKLVDEKQDAVAKINNTEQQIEEKRNEQDVLQREIDSINEKLEQIEDVADLQTDRKELESNRKKLRETRKRLKTELQSDISKHGYLPFAMEAIEETAKDIDRLREQGRIPSELNNEFVEGLLDERECICGRPLEEDSESYRSVASYKSDVSSEGVDQAAIRYIAHLENIRSDHSSFFDSVESIVSERKDIQDQIDTLSEEIDEFSAQIENTSGYNPETDESPKELEQKRRENNNRLQRLGGQIDKLQEEKKDLEETKRKIKEEIDGAREDEEEAQLARKRMKAAELVRQQLESSFTELQQEVRSWSNERVRKTFGSIATKDYTAEITEDFELRIREEVGADSVKVDKSRGERQIASLAFIGSLVSIAKERYEKNSDTVYFQGGIYPIVMDSPFGALDNEHRREISRVIPTLAEQVVVFVTDSQWYGPVAEEMEDITGREYRLNYDDGSESGHPQTTIELEEEALQEI